MGCFHINKLIKNYITNLFCGLVAVIISWVEKLIACESYRNIKYTEEINISLEVNAQATTIEYWLSILAVGSWLMKTKQCPIVNLDEENEDISIM